MAPSPPASTDGSKTWAPSHLFDNDTDIWDRIHGHLNANEFKAAVTTAFELSRGDNFTYHAAASVNLAQVEAAIHAGRANGLHAWYIEPVGDATATVTGDEDGANGENDLPVKENEGEKKEEESSSSVTPDQPSSLRVAGYPPPADIHAYISLFDPTKSAANSLKSLAANAKKGSLRAGIAEYLLSKRYLDSSINVPKFKISAPPKPSKARNGSAGGEGETKTSSSSPAAAAAARGHENPALDFWAYSCMALEWAGPNAHTARVRSSHHLLPVYMHHFGCVVPSWESLQVIAKLAGPGGSVIDMGSGNGYWTLMLRRLLGTLGGSVVAVDSGQSRWRTTWIADTQAVDGVQYLRRRGGCASAVLLLVYPVVGRDGEGEFTRRVLDAFTGAVVCVVGTQNGNGYTGFKDMMVDEYMRQQRPDWDKVAQVPLPSFAGKDDALFAFRRRKPVD